MTKLSRVVTTLLLATALAGGCGGEDERLSVGIDAAPIADAGPAVDAPPTTDAMPGAFCASGTRRIYLNPGGGTYRPVASGGTDDSSTNTSTLARNGDAVLPAWPADAATLTTLRTCVARNFAAYDVQVVDADPGAAEHIEVVLTTTIEPLGLGGGPGLPGVAPASSDCSPIRRGMVFYNATAYGASIAELCDSVSRSVGNDLGLDNVLDARNIMSWLTGRFEERRFLDTEAMCGENTARACRCTGTTERSHQKLLAALGACPG